MREKERGRKNNGRERRRIKKRRKGDVMQERRVREKVGGKRENNIPFDKKTIKLKVHL